jgi:hypothetical protein
VAALDGTPLSPIERMDVVMLMSGHLRDTQAVDVTGRQPWHDRSHLALLQEQPDRFPALLQLPARATRTPRQTRDFGMRCILDGVQQAIDAAGA